MGLVACEEKWWTLAEIWDAFPNMIGSKADWVVHEVRGLLCSCFVFKTIVCVCVISWVPFHQVPVWGHLTWFTCINISLSTSLPELYTGFQPYSGRGEESVSPRGEGGLPREHVSCHWPSQKLPNSPLSWNTFPCLFPFMQWSEKDELPIEEQSGIILK